MSKSFLKWPLAIILWIRFTLELFTLNYLLILCICFVRLLDFIIFSLRFVWTLVFNNYFLLLIYLNLFTFFFLLLFWFSLFILIFILVFLFFLIFIPLFIIFITWWKRHLIYLVLVLFLTFLLIRTWLKSLDPASYILFFLIIAISHQLIQLFIFSLPDFLNSFFIIVNYSIGDNSFILL